MRDANHRALVHLGQGHDGCFHFAREHIETTRNDHVLLAIHNVEEAVFIAISDIARMVPTKCANFRRGLRQVEVAGRNERSASDNLSGLIGRQELSLIIHDCEAHAVGGFAAASQALRVISGGSGGHGSPIQPRHQHGNFRLAVALAQTGAENFHSLFEAIGRHRRSSQQKYPEAGMIGPPHVGVGKQSIKRSGRKEDVSYMVDFDAVEDCSGIESRQDYIGGSHTEHSERDRSCRMGKRGCGETHGRSVRTLPVMSGHFHESAPGIARNSYPFRWPGGAAGGHETDQPVGIPARIGPIRRFALNRLLDELGERRVVMIFGIDANEVAQRRHS